MSSHEARLLNAFGLLGCSGILLVAFGYQIGLGELPCPLCILQRLAFVAAGTGLALNICLGPRPSHYAVTILSAVVGAGIATRQTLLHIVPGTGAYGADLFGLHFYVWALIAFVGIIVATALLCLWDAQFADEPDRSGTGRIGAFGRVSTLLFLAVTLANAGSTVAECGGGLCPDNPTRYEYWDAFMGR